MNRFKNSMFLNLSRARERADLFHLEYNVEREVSSLDTCTPEYPLSLRRLSLRVVYERGDINSYISKRLYTLSFSLSLLETLYILFLSLSLLEYLESFLPPIIPPSSLLISSGVHHG